MNEEYINLPNNESKIKDTNGNIKKKETKVNDKILMLENKIKKVKDEKELIKLDLNQAKNEVSVAKALLKIRPFLLAGALLGGFALGGAFTGGMLLPVGINALVSGFVAGAITYTILSTRYISILKDAEKKVELFETKLEEANKLEEKYENELESVKELLNTNALKVTLEPVSLKEKNEIELPKIEKEIEKNTEEKLEEKQKKLVLKRN